MKTEYLSCKETAQLMRKALKKAFPGFKFSVRCDHGSINVNWTDGPTEADVEAITGQYQGGSFDGMIDMQYSVTHWLLPDGSAVVADNPGTTGSMGLVESETNPAPDFDAQLVHFGATFVFTHRHLSPAFLQGVVDAFGEANGPDSVKDVEVLTSGFDGHGYIKNTNYGDDWAERTIYAEAQALAAC